MPRKLFKGGNYSRAETIRGNTVSLLMRFFLFAGLDLINSTSGDVFFVNKTFLVVEQTELRSNIEYIQYYILLTNFIFMGIIPSIIMIIFNVLVVRAVNEANQRRARMTRRQQRNITVTSMLVSWKWKKIGILLQKLFWPLRTFWDHLNNSFENCKVRIIF